MWWLPIALHSCAALRTALKREVMALERVVLNIHPAFFFFLSV